ncbi:MAG: hypothetical protein WAZ94_07275 [Phycisphaerales bacterium]
MTTPTCSTLTILSKVKRSNAPGTWVTGVCLDHSFTALAFPVPAAEPAFEIRPGCRISKLELRRGPLVLANFDRGWDVNPGDSLAMHCVACLVDSLADQVFGTAVLL